MSDYEFSKDIQAVGAVLEKPPETEQLIPRQSEIHTINAGTMEGHLWISEEARYSADCRCRPQRHPDDPRIFVHQPLTLEQHNADLAFRLAALGITQAPPT